MAGGQNTEGDANPSQPAPDTTLADFGPVKKPKRNRYVLACATLASMTSVLLGYDVGVMSGASIYIQYDLINISDLQVALLVGTLSLYSLVGSAAGGWTSDWIGRRYTIVMAGAMFFVGSILMGFATNYAFLMVGRFVAGVGGGYALMIAPVYTAEVSPASSREFLTSFEKVFNSAGILLGYVSNYAFSKLPTHLGWRFMLGIGAIPSVFLVLFGLVMPESPRWLGMQGRLGDARKVLDKTFYSKKEYQQRLSDIKEAAGIPQDCNDDDIDVQKQSHGLGVWKELLVDPTPSVRHILICGIGINFFQRASGIDAFIYYSPGIFEEAGIKSSNGSSLLATVAVGFTKTVFNLVASFLLERIGRRPLLLSSVGGMVLSLTTLGFGLTMIDHHKSDKKPQWAVALSIAMVFANVSFFSIGMGPITGVYSSEIFPSRLRAQGTSMGELVNKVTSEVIATTFFMLYEAITMGGSFFLFAGIAAVAWVFFFVCLPETRTSEDMDVLYDSYIEWWSALKDKQKKDVSGENGGQIQMGGTVELEEHSSYGEVHPMLDPEADRSI
ncbi:POLYOL TRANSPORTER 5-LIKE [Salix koriyanagi]|uniref:POLYOL TRANSPORTER 5-LIKE n=1 Tax=Salix koriyanagi TaxID=2511006 RepID=A0A9Q0TS16_9ROSI|nr:POLYOL TRANSPORTER 5-LIKE [Salix koriyanagi]